MMPVRVWERQLQTLSSRGMVALVDSLLCRFLRALNPVDADPTDLDRVLWLRAEWLTVEDRIERIVEELTKIAESAHTATEVDAAVTRFGQRHPELSVREETLPW